jgi:uncharacterized protein YjbI with pentapeptide repeats
MANQEHLDLLKQGLDSWNIWRQHFPKILPDLREANLSDYDLRGYDLINANLSDANLHRADLLGADLSGANLHRADLRRVYLRGAGLTEATMSDSDLSDADLSRTYVHRANFSGASLLRANLRRADLSDANFSDADLSWSDLSEATFVRTKLYNAKLDNCRVYGTSVWDVDLKDATQSNLIITDLYSYDQTITVDNLEVAQFIYLLLKNEKIRDVINTIGQKGVLILGRFSKERKQVLDALREKLRTLNFLPIVFDFECPTERDFTETIMTLAGMSCFIIADITNPKSSPLELQATVPNYMIPFVPILQECEQPFSMFRDLKGKYDWVLDILVYDTPSNLIRGLERAVVQPALEKRDELLPRKVEQLRTRHIEEYL